MKSNRSFKQFILSPSPSPPPNTAQLTNFSVRVLRKQRRRIWVCPAKAGDSLPRTWHPQDPKTSQGPSTEALHCHGGPLLTTGLGTPATPLPPASLTKATGVLQVLFCAEKCPFSQISFRLLCLYWKQNIWNVKLWFWNLNLTLNDYLFLPSSLPSPPI